MKEQAKVALSHIKALIEHPNLRILNVPESITMVNSYNALQKFVEAADIPAPQAEANVTTIPKE